jgi:hypothetical protein
MWTWTILPLTSHIFSIYYGILDHQSMIQYATSIPIRHDCQQGDAGRGIVRDIHGRLDADRLERFPATRLSTIDICELGRRRHHLPAC